MYIAPHRLYLTRDGRLVREGDPDAHTLFVHAGGRVPFQLARRYGLVETQAPAAPTETQHLPGPPATVQRRRR